MNLSVGMANHRNLASVNQKGNRPADLTAYNAFTQLIAIPKRPEFQHRETSEVLRRWEMFMIQPGEWPPMIRFRADRIRWGPSVVFKISKHAKEGEQP